MGVLLSWVGIVVNDHVCVCFLQGAMCFLREKDGDLVGHTLIEYGLEFFYFILFFDYLSVCF